MYSSEPLLAEQGAKAPTQARSCLKLVGCVSAVGVTLFCARTLSTSSARGASPALRLPESAPLFRPSCKEGGPSPCIRADHAGIKGDARKDRFARKDENLVFYEDFSEGRVDRRVWNIHRDTWGDGNNCFMVYTDSEENVYVNTTDKSLRLRPGLFSDLGIIETAAGPQKASEAMIGACEPYPACATFTMPGCTANASLQGACTRIADRWGYNEVIGPATSGKLTTKGKFSYTYGRLEIEMRLPAADWTWPAVWMLPEQEKYGEWPAYGEIDLMESHGNAANFTAWGLPSGRDRFAGTLHYYGNTWWAPGVQGSAIADVQRVDWSTHRFTLGFYWSESEMYMYVQDPVTNKELVYVNVTGLDRPEGGHAFYDAPLGAPFNVPAEDAPLHQKMELTDFTSDPEKEPYRNAAPNAPFDAPYYLVLNVAVGGAQLGCPGGFWGGETVWCKCAPNCHGAGEAEFWRRVNEWYPGWQESSARDRLGMAIHSVKVWQ